MAIRLRYLGFASFQLFTDEGTNVLIDPWVAGDPDHGIPHSPFNVEDFDDVDLIFVSHGGRDHLGEAVEIMQRSKAKLAGTGDVLLHARKHGIAAERLVSALCGVTVRFKDITARVTDARHQSLIKSDQPLVGQPVGFVIRSATGESIYHAGDTALFGDMRLIGELHEPDIAIIGAGSAQGGGYMTPHETALAVEWLKAKAYIPMHYTTTSTGPRECAAALAERCPSVVFRQMTPGEELVFDRRKPNSLRQ